MRLLAARPAAVPWKIFPEEGKDIKKNKRISKLLKIKCSQCGACCCDPMIEVTHHDLQRLVKHTGMEADRLVKLYSGSELNSDPDDEGWIALSYGKRKMGLRKKQDGSCMFLSGDRRCNAYEARPVSCRIFPVDVVLDDDNNIIDLELSDVIREKFIKCSYSYGRGISHKQFLRAAHQSRDETESYWKKLERWNSLREKGRKENFLRFIGAAK